MYVCMYVCMYAATEEAKATENRQSHEDDSSGEMHMSSRTKSQMKHSMHIQQTKANGTAHVRRIAHEIKSQMKHSMHIPQKKANGKAHVPGQTNTRHAISTY